MGTGIYALLSSFKFASANPELTAPIIQFNWTSLMILITVLFLFLILKKYFFEKVYNFVKSREATLQDAFDSAEMTNKAADAKLEDYEKKVAQAEAQGRSIIKEAKIKADNRAQRIIDEANEKTTLMIKQAEEEIERQKRKALEEMRSEIGTLALMAAEKIIENEIKKDKEQDKIVDKVIKEVGNSKWQS